MEFPHVGSCHVTPKFSKSRAASDSQECCFVFSSRHLPIHGHCSLVVASPSHAWVGQWHHDWELTSLTAFSGRQSLYFFRSTFLHRSFDPPHHLFHAHLLIPLHHNTTNKVSGVLRVAALLRHCSAPPSQQGQRHPSRATLSLTPPPTSCASTSPASRRLTSIPVF